MHIEGKIIYYCINSYKGRFFFLLIIQKCSLTVGDLYQDGDKFWRMPECYIRGSTIKYLRIPDEVIDMVKEDIQTKTRGRGEVKGRGQAQRGRGGGRGNNIQFKV